MDNTLFKELLSKLPSGYALFQISPDDAHPTAYTFVDVNPAFELFTGLSISAVKGKKISEISCHAQTSNFSWTNFYEALIRDPAGETKEISDLNVFFFDDTYFVTLFNVTKINPSSFKSGN